MRLRTVLVDWPARIVDVAIVLYMVVLAGAAFTCITAVLLVLAAYWLGFPLQ